MSQAHKGAGHWRVQRVTALALIPLTIWFVAALALLPDYGFETVQAWASVRWHAIAMSLLVACIVWHSQLGVQVVIEDYVHGSLTKPSLLLNTIAHVVLGIAGVVAPLSIAFKG